MSRKGWNKSPKGKGVRKIYVDYHVLPFAKFHSELDSIGLDHGLHQARAEFWSLVPPGQYAPEQGRELVISYVKSVETKLAAILSKNSMSYFLHVYRRLAPYSVGEDQRPMTIALVRMTLEAAIQKYALPGLCGRVGNSAEVPPEAIFKGLLFKDERLWRVYGPGFKQHPQLVLTDFGARELAEFYTAEKLAYEVWKSSAVLRALGKGAPLRVFDSGEYFADDRSSDLHDLLTRYDDRDRFGNVSATGTVFASTGRGHSPRGVIPLPTYNVSHEPWGRFRDSFRAAFGLDLTSADLGEKDAAPNFLWGPFDLLSFYEAHEPFAAAFQQTHGFGLKSAVAVVAALSVRTFTLWSRDSRVLIRQWFRAYDGPDLLQDWIDVIREALPGALLLVPLGISAADVEVEAAVRFFSWSERDRLGMDLVVAGPHAFFLPSGGRLFTDYAWVAQRLYRLFHGLKLDDQNFKGDALEVLVRRGASALPVKPCKGADGTSKQIDAAFNLGDLLLIVECKVKGISIGWERGDPAAVLERQNFVYDAIRQADDKAIWISHRAIGRNYDISRYSWVLAVVVTPFPEFIWSKEEYYWINGKLPRIMTAAELADALEDGTFASAGPHHQMAMPVRDAHPE